MEHARKRTINDSYFALEIFECPKELFLFAARLASENVTIENFTHFGRNRGGFSFQIESNNIRVQPALKRFDIDFTITKHEFLQLADLWDEQGCYAIFHEKPIQRFKATDLPENQRYLALDNFGWTLEISIPGSASDGWAQIASPRKEMMEKIEERLNDLMQ